MWLLLWLTLSSPMQLWCLLILGSNNLRKRTWHVTNVKQWKQHLSRVTGYTPSQTKTICRDCKWERSIQLAKCSPYRKAWFCSTRVLLEMLSVYAMACNLLYYHHIAYVAPSILWSMPWIAHQEAFLQFDTMRCETWPLHSSVKYVIMYIQNLHCSHYRVNTLSISLPMER